MSQDEIPVLLFVAQHYSTPIVQRLVENWRIEPIRVIEKLADHLREMGIYRVPYKHERLLMSHIIHLLRHSPEIQRMVSKASQDEAKRQRRHAE